MIHLLRDLRYSLRSIRAMPGLAAIVILSLGVGIGVNTVVFSWVQTAMLRPLSGVADSGSLTWIEPKTETGMYPGTSWIEYQDLRDRLRAFGDVLAFRMAPLYVGEPGETERAYGLLVSANYFSALGLRPALGRFLLADEVTRPGGAPVIVISYDYWRNRLNGRPDALGQTLRVNATRLTIVGVTPPRFEGTVPRLKFDLFLPATLAPVVQPGSRELDQRAARGYSAMATPRPGIGRKAAQEELTQAMRELAQRHPDTNAGISADALAFWAAARGPQKFMAVALATLQAILLVLLLCVCGNTANLILARASSRYQEIGVRLALGASPWRVASLLLSESLLLASGGVLLGSLLALEGSDALAALPPLRVRGLPITFQTAISSGTFVFAILLGLACGVLFALPAIVQLTRIDPLRALRAGARTSGRSTLRNALMGIQVALAAGVLIAAGLFLRSFADARGTDPGFRRAGVLLAEYDLTGRDTPAAGIRTFADRALTALARVPGVEAVAMASSVPLDIHGLPSRVFSVEGHARTDGGFDQSLTNTVSPGYFRVLDIPILQGTDFAPLGDTAAPLQAIVNDAFVRQYLDGVQAVGRRLIARGKTFVIAGVVRTSTYNAYGEPPQPIIYLSYRDNPVPVSELHFRTRPGAETSIVPKVRQVMRELDAELPVYDVRTMNDHLESNLLFRRIPARMFSVLGPLILILAAIGIYGVVAYAVSLRRTEIGVRLALGATAAGVVRQFVGESLRVVGAGALAGWTITVVLVLDVFAAASLDSVVFAIVPVLLIGVATLACWIPARRAIRTDVWTVLRRD